MYALYRFRLLVLFPALVLLISVDAVPVRAQTGCMTFAEARKAGLFSGRKMPSASAVKQDVESRTGGKVVSFVVCQPGPVYQLTVLRPDNSVVTMNVPAQ